MLVPVSPPNVSQATSDAHLISLWLRGKSEHSTDAYARDVKQFLDFTVDTPLSEVKLQDIWDWADHLKAQGMKPTTYTRKLAAVKSLFSFGHTVGYLPFNVGAAAVLPSVPDTLAMRIVTEDDVRKIIPKAESFHDRVLLKMIYATGARVSELAGLTWQNLVARGEGGGQVTLLGKGNKTRTLLLQDSMWLDLMALKAEANPMFEEDSVFKSPSGGAISRQHIWRVVNKATKAAGFKQNVSPHWFRHAHASHALDNGAPVHLVKDSLGHASLTTTSKYTHARPTESSCNYISV